MERKNRYTGQELYAAQVQAAQGGQLGPRGRGEQIVQARGFLVCDPPVPPSADLVATLRAELHALAEKNAELKARIAKDETARENRAREKESFAHTRIRELEAVIRGREAKEHELIAIYMKQADAADRRANALSDKCGAMATELKDAHATIGRYARVIERLERTGK